MARKGDPIKDLQKIAAKAQANKNKDAVAYNEKGQVSLAKTAGNMPPITMRDKISDIPNRFAESQKYMNEELAKKQEEERQRIARQKQYDQTIMGTLEKGMTRMGNEIKSGVESMREGVQQGARLTPLKK
jgi:hypothetical protein